MIRSLLDSASVVKGIMTFTLHPVKVFAESLPYIVSIQEL